MDRDRDVQEIERILHRELESIKAGDVDTMMSIRTGDFVSMPPNAPTIEGSEAIREFLSGFTGVGDFTGSRFHSPRIAISGDLAVGRVSYETKDGPE